MTAWVRPFSLKLKNEEPIKQRYFPRNPTRQEIINKEINVLFEENRIEPSTSPYCSPIVLVRQLNKNAVKEAYPLPQIPPVLDKLRGAKFISTIDLKQGYWQIHMAENSRQYTVLTVPGRGLFQWKVMPFGIHSAPAVFQRT